MQMFHRIKGDERFLDSVIFSDKSKFRVSNLKIWSSENPRVSPEHVPVLRPQQRKRARPFLRYGDENYRYRVSGYALTVPHSRDPT
jgi:hypothetical protein